MHQREKACEMIHAYLFCDFTFNTEGMVLRQQDESYQLPKDWTDN